MLATTSQDSSGVPSRACKYCGAEFSPRDYRQIFCLQKCRKKWHARSEKQREGIRAWKIAHPEYMPTYMKTRWQRKDRETSIIDEKRVCKHCGNSFAVTGGRQLKKSYCSKKCKDAKYMQAYNKVYRQKNREAFNKYSKAHYVKRREAILKRRSEWAKAHASIINAKTRRRRAIKRGAQGSHTGKEFELICKKQNYKCAHCGEKKKLSADHIMPISKGGSNFAFNLMALCGSCNSAKHNKILPYAHPSLFDTR